MKEIRISFKSRLLILLVLFLLVSGFVLITNSFSKLSDLNSVTKSELITNYSKIPSSIQIFSDQHLIQSVYCSNSNVNSFSVFMPNQFLNIDSITLINKDSGISSQIDIESLSSTENGWITIPVSNHLADNSNIDIDISFYDADAVSIPAYDSFDTSSSLSVGSVISNKNLLVKSVYNESNNISLFVCIAFLVGIILFSLLFNGFTVRAFLLFSLIFGLLLIALIPFPYNYETDEYLTTASISETNELINYRTEFLNNNGTWLPSGSINETSLLGGNINAHTSEDYSFFKTNDFSFTSPIAHVPSAIGYKIAQQFNLSHYFSVVLSRLFVFLFYVIPCAYAVYISKKYRPAIFISSVLPCFMFLSSSMISSAVVIAFSVLFISICVSHYDDTKESTFRISQFVLASVSLLIIGTYNLLLFLPVCFLFFSIPNTYGNYRKTVYSWIMALLVCGVFAIQTLLILNKSEEFSSFSSIISSGFRPLAEDPLAFISGYLTTVVKSGCVAVGSMFFPLANTDPFYYVAGGICSTVAILTGSCIWLSDANNSVKPVEVEKVAEDDSMKEKENIASNNQRNPSVKKPGLFFIAIPLLMLFLSSIVSYTYYAFNPSDVLRVILPVIPVSLLCLSIYIAGTREKELKSRVMTFAAVIVASSCLLSISSLILS